MVLDCDMIIQQVKLLNCSYTEDGLITENTILIERRQSNTYL